MSAVAEPIGWVALMLAMHETDVPEELLSVCERRKIRWARGPVGGIGLEKVIAAATTAAKREGVVDGGYPEGHALYHAILEAVHGVVPGNMALQDILRTAGLRFAVTRGVRWPGAEHDGERIAVAIYGTMGAPVKGYEHEAVGLGVNHI